jgi:hypothetical protein
MLRQYGYASVEPQPEWLQLLLKYIDVQLVPQGGTLELFHRLLGWLWQVLSATLGHPAFATSITLFRLLTAMVFTFICLILRHSVPYAIAVNKIDIYCGLEFLKYYRKHSVLLGQIQHLCVSQNVFGSLFFFQLYLFLINFCSFKILFIL